jgi:hypothetical protein
LSSAPLVLRYQESAEFHLRLAARMLSEFPQNVEATTMAASDEQGVFLSFSLLFLAFYTAVRPCNALMKINAAIA